MAILDPPPTTIRIERPSGKEVDLYLVFNLSRGALKFAEITQHFLEKGFVFPEDIGPLPRNVLFGRLSEGEGDLEISVDSRQELPELIKAIVRIDGERTRVFRPERAFFSEDGVFQVSLDEGKDIDPVTLREHILDPAAYSQQLDSALESGENLKEKRYFTDLDYVTHLDLIDLHFDGDKDYRKQSINILMPLLRERLVERGRQYEDAKSRGPEEEIQLGFVLQNKLLSTDDLGPLKNLSKAQIEVVRGSFAGSQAGIDLPAVERAYETFANGILRVQLQPSEAWACQPSSGYYFLFAEFALLTIETRQRLDYDPAWTPFLPPKEEVEAWQCVANVMVRTQEIFAESYGPNKTRGQKLGFFDYHPANWDCPRYSDTAGLKQNYAGDDLNALATAMARNIVEALPGILEDPESDAT